MKITADKARTLAARDHHPGQNPYVILSGDGIQPPYPEHRAANDTEVMRRLFLSLGVAPDFFDAPKPKKRKKKPPVPKADRRKLNQQMLERTGYNFVYLKNSPVFHRRDCKICLAAKSTAEILGSVYYETAAEARRPCRVCNPVPLVSHEKYEKRQQLSDQREEFAETVVTVKTIKASSEGRRSCRTHLHLSRLFWPHSVIR